jgi:signal transduction histidine kinase
MSVHIKLAEIREQWVSRVSHELARGEGVREIFLDELNRFYDLLLQAVESGDSGWLKSLLIEWAQSRTETEAEEAVVLPPLMSGIVEKTFDLLRETLPPEEALEAIATLTPIFTYCYEQLAYQEMILRIAFVTAQLEKTKVELRRMDRSKSDFISVAAHELKTPLTLIEGYTSMLREQLSSAEHSQNLPAMLKGIDQGADRLAEIINDMIDVSMIDNKLLALNFQPAWPNRILESLKYEFQAVAGERGQMLEFRDFPGAKEITFADADRVYQAIRNVIVNAIKFTPDGGQIVVDGRLLSGFLEITVTDSGIGIDSENHTKIFEKFGRLGDVALHSSGKTKFKGGGPGLGLAITKGILEAHGGSIWVESKGYNEEKLPGSNFHILIPLRSEPPDEELAKLYGSLTLDSKRVAPTEGEPAV